MNGMVYVPGQSIACLLSIVLHMTVVMNCDTRTFLFFSFLFCFYFHFSIFRIDLHNQGSHMISHMISHIDMSHDYHGKVVHRPSRIDISSVLKSSRNSNEFSLSTLT